MQKRHWWVYIIPMNIFDFCPFSNLMVFKVKNSDTFGSATVATVIANMCPFVSLLNDFVVKINS